MVSRKFWYRPNISGARGALPLYVEFVLDVPTGRGFSAAFTLPYIFIQFAHAGAVVRLGDSQVA